MYDFFDVETTGLPNYKLPKDHPSQPHIAQIAAIQVGSRAEGFPIQNQMSCIIKPEGYVIPKEASDIHRVTHERAMRYGVPLSVAMAKFQAMCQGSRYLVAHNIRFDLFIVASQLKRLRWDDSFLYNMQQYCTMERTRDLVAIPPTPKMINANILCNKSPKLEEAYEWFFGYKFDGAHDALEDVKATVEVFKAVQHYGTIKALCDAVAAP